MSTLKRYDYYEVVNTCLAIMAFSVENMNSVCLFDINHFAEYVYMEILNSLFGWHLENANTFDKNSSGIDLVYKKDQIIVQVSSVATKKKINESLAKISSDYDGSTFKFVSIVKSVKNLKKHSYTLPHGINLSFDPNEDCIDRERILNEFTKLKLEEQKNLAERLQAELNVGPFIGANLQHDRDELYTLFSNFSTYYMDEVLHEEPTRVNYDIMIAADLWLIHRSSSAFSIYDPELLTAIDDFINAWKPLINVWEQEYIPSEPYNDYYVFMNLRHDVYVNDGEKQMNKIRSIISQLAPKYERLVDIAKMKYRIDLYKTNAAFAKDMHSD